MCDKFVLQMKMVASIIKGEDQRKEAFLMSLDRDEEKPPKSEPTRVDRRWQACIFKGPSGRRSPFRQ
jgi:hypothetical protein